MSENITEKNSYGGTETLRQGDGCALWFWWVLANAAGGLVGYAVPLVAFDRAGGIFLDARVIVGVVAGGAVLGFAQWLVLRRYIQRMTRWEWVLATALGGFPVLGFGQWLVLRRYIQKAGWWALANAVAWPVGVPVYVIGVLLLLDYQLRGRSTDVPWIVSGVLMGVVVGAITGIALVWLLRTHLSRSGKHSV